MSPEDKATVARDRAVLRILLQSCPAGDPSQQQCFENVLKPAWDKAIADSRNPKTAACAKLPIIELREKYSKDLQDMDDEGALVVGIAVKILEKQIYMGCMLFPPNR